MKIPFSTLFSFGRSKPQLAVWTGCLALAGTLSWTPPQEPDVRLEEARTALEQLYETRRLISREQSDWEVSQAWLKDEIELSERELEVLRQQIADKAKEGSQAQAAVEELIEASEEARVAAQSMEARVIAWEKRLRTLIPRLPNPLQDQLRSLAQSLPTAGEEARISLSKRFITVVFLLTQINQFHSEVNVSSEVLTLSDGTQAEVRTLYLGISQGYYVATDGSQAGVGQSSETGWDWKPQAEAAEAITQAIAILENEQPAGFVRLPIHIQ